MSRDTDVYLTLFSVTLFLLRNLTTIITAIQIIITIITIRIPTPRITYNVTLLPAVSGSGYLLEVLVSVAKFVSSVVAASAEDVVDSAGAEEDDDVGSRGVTLQFRSEYISAL